MSEIHLLAGAYAAGALEAGEREEFTEHLASCNHCTVEVRELLETTALLGIAAAAPAPPAMRAAVLAEIAHTRQLAPVVVALGERAGRRTLLRRATMTAAACLAVFSIGLGAYAIQLADENGDLKSANSELHDVLTAPDARTFTAAGAGATAAAAVSKANNRIEFLSRGLPTRSGRTYQLWLVGTDGPRSAGVFTPSNGKHDPVLIEGPGDASTLALTDEPKGGSMQPTTPIIMAMTLKKA
ncbi:MAG: anti-sigma factor [Sporichthyaceae bacterium]